MSARILFITALLIAAPGLLLQAFEMYGLTLSGSQMLFFSIAHTMPLAVAAVALAVPAGLVALVQATIGLLRPNYAQRLGVPKEAARTLVVFLVVHFTALIGYKVWAPMDYVRIPVCIAGITLLAAVVVRTLPSLRDPNTGDRHRDA